MVEVDTFLDILWLTKPGEVGDFFKMNLTTLVV
jgi:hypothetical protein